MPTYKNNRKGAITLSQLPGCPERLIPPGAIFEAIEEEVPVSWLTTPAREAGIIDHDNPDGRGRLPDTDLTPIVSRLGDEG